MDTSGWVALIIGVAAIVPALASIPESRGRKRLIGLTAGLVVTAVIVGLAGNFPHGKATPPPLTSSNSTGSAPSTTISPSGLTSSHSLSSTPHPTPSATISTRPISIVGTWLSSLGHTYYFKSTGNGSYLGEEFGQAACSPADISLTEQDSRLYVGTVPLYNGCNSTGQTATSTMLISADGETAQVNAYSNGCGNCGPQTWTRESTRA
jgi:hypothetical protein